MTRQSLGTSRKDEPPAVVALAGRRVVGAHEDERRSGYGAEFQ
jgi:hypothetical protein